MRLGNKGGCGVAKEIMEVITKVNGGKKVIWRCGLKNKLIVFIYYLKLFFTLRYFTKYT